MNHEYAFIQFLWDGAEASALSGTTVSTSRYPVACDGTCWLDGAPNIISLKEVCGYPSYSLHPLLLLSSVLPPLIPPLCQGLDFLAGEHGHCLPKSSSGGWIWIPFGAAPPVSFVLRENVL